MKTPLIVNHLLAIAIITIVMAVIYLTAQQIYRTNLDDPQVQLVQDTEMKLNQGVPLTSILPLDTVQINESLRPFIVLYDNNGMPIQSTGFLDKYMPRVPKGVLEFTKAHDEYRVTWQPRKGVRMAMVIRYTNYPPVAFIAAGRSMQEVENRSLRMGSLVFKAWVICLLLVIISAITLSHLSIKKQI
ncbi:MAG TPA: hypothetical protein VK498_09950 [Ferruginibacter sp.]|nr:hypothetical protein [Ferruginibacter sp.]